MEFLDRRLFERPKRKRLSPLFASLAILTVAAASVAVGAEAATLLERTGFLKTEGEEARSISVSLPASRLALSAASAGAFVDETARALYRALCPFFSNCEDAASGKAVVVFSEPRAGRNAAQPPAPAARATPPPKASPERTDETPTIVQHITNPVVERIVERLVSPSPTASTGVNESFLNSRLQELETNLSSRMLALASANSADTRAVYNVVGEMGRIENLSGTSLSDVTVSGVSGLTDADIPDGLTASNYLPLTGGTLSGDLSITGDFTVSGAQSLSGAITIPYLSATSTTATSTFAGGLTVQTDALVVQDDSGNVGVGTSTPTSALDVYGTTTAHSFAFSGNENTWELRGRGTDVASWGVPFFRSTILNSPTSLDILPNGTGGSESTGKAWIDVCNSDLSPANSDDFECLVLTAAEDRFAVGSHTGGTGSHLPLNVGGSSVIIRSTAFGTGTEYAKFTNLGSYFSPSGTDRMWITDGDIRLGASMDFRWNDGATPYSSSLDTGIARNSPGVIEINTGTAGSYGDLRLRSINPSSGNIGIGTTSPAQKLHVADGKVRASNADGTEYSDIDFSGLNINRNTAYITASQVLLYRATTQTFTNTSGATTYMQITDSGNVGIGTTTPGAKLDAQGNVRIGTSVSSGNNLTFTRPASGDNTLYFDSGDTTRNFVRSNRGSSPYELEMAAGSGLNLIIDVGNTQSNTAFTVMHNGGQGVGSELFRVQENGNIGIGTTNPDEGKVEVKGGTVCVDTNSDDTASSCIASESDERLKTNITSMSASSSLDAILALRPVSFDWKATDPEVLKHWPALARYASSTRSVGLIAQEVIPVLPEALSLETVGDDEVQYLQLDYTKFIPTVIGAIQALHPKLTDLATTVASFADRFTTRELSFVRAEGDHIGAKEITADERLCIGSTCITEAELVALLSQSTAANLANPTPTTGTPPTNIDPANPSPDHTDDTSTGTTPTEPPTIEINGNTPARIQIGDTYNDLGARITGPTQADTNLGIKTFLNGALVSNIVLGTTAPATNTIDYVASNAAGTSTSTRTVIIGAQTPAASPTDETISTNPPNEARDPNELQTEEPATDEADAGAVKPQPIAEIVLPPVAPE